MSGAVERNHGGPSSLSGRWSPRADGEPNVTGAIVIEHDLQAGSKLWLSGWTRTAAGCDEYACPNIRGGITIERDLPANTRLWLTGWAKTILGGEFASILVEIADKARRARQ
jgi:hypothetical protein